MKDENCELGFGDSFSLYIQLRSHLGEGNKFDASKRDQIVKSRTTAQELESLMGKPYKVEKKQAAKRNIFIITTTRNTSAGTSFRNPRCRNSKLS